jgi:methionine sulfoxide reductase heme-binding subunit
MVPAHVSTALDPVVTDSQGRHIPTTGKQPHRNQSYGFSQTPPVVIVHVVAEFIVEDPLRHPLKVWHDPSDHISALRIITLICLLAPLSKMIYDFDEIRLDPRPITNLIHRTGDWALIFLLVALAVRPLSRILRYNQLLDVRRMIGVGAFAYAATHFTLYIVDQMFDWREIASEIVHRSRLTLGFVALLSLTALAATSTNGMVRRLGINRWQRLHQAIYLIGLLVLIHYFLRFKLIESTPTLAAGLFGWLIGYRLLIWWRKTGNELPTWMLLALSVMVAALTFIAEAIALGVQANVSPLRVLQSALDFDTIRPGWLVLGAGLMVVVLDFACARFAKQRRAARRVERALAA